MLHFLNFNWQLLPLVQQQQEDLKALASIEKKLKDFQSLALQEHFPLLILLQNELADSANTFARLKPDTTIHLIKH